MRKLGAILAFLFCLGSAALAFNQQTIRRVVATNTLSVVPNAGQDLNLVWVHVIYTATASAGNRFIDMALLDPNGNIVSDYETSVAITANQAAYHVEFMPGVFRETTFDANHTVQETFPVGFIIPSGYTLRVRDLTNVDAADSMIVSYQVRSVE